MRIFSLLFLLNFITLTAYSTGQNGDIIIWNNKKYALFSNPLESYPKFDLLRDTLFGEKEPGTSTACVRGYVAEWQITNNQLYLINIYACHNFDLKADLNLLFPDRVKNGKIKADWVNETLLLPEGDCIFYGNLGYVSIYEKEYELVIKNGKLIEQAEHDNSKSHISVFTQKPDSLMKFIDQNIRWETIPDTINKPIRVNLILTTTDTNKPDIRIIRGSGIKLYDDEALRVASQIPDWDVYIQRGKVFKMSWSLPIIFSKEKINKYTH